MRSKLDAVALLASTRTALFIGEIGIQLALIMGSLGSSSYLFVSSGAYMYSSRNLRTRHTRRVVGEVPMKRFSSGARRKHQSRARLLWRPRASGRDAKNWRALKYTNQSLCYMYFILREAAPETKLCLPQTLFFLFYCGQAIHRGF